MTQPTRASKHPRKVSTPAGGWPAGGRPSNYWVDCDGCGDTIFPGEHIYEPATTTGVLCAICEVKRRTAGARP